MKNWKIFKRNTKGGREDDPELVNAVDKIGDKFKQKKNQNFNQLDHQNGVITKEAKAE